jgi:Fusaric acid resistance protein-like
MSPTTGASLNGLFTRCLGTIVGGVVAMGVWYMVDQRAPGVIVLSLVVLAVRKSRNEMFDVRFLFLFAGSETDTNDSQLFHHIFVDCRLCPGGDSQGGVDCRSAKLASTQLKQADNNTSPSTN